MMIGKYRKYTIKEVGIAIKESISWRQTAFKLGLNGNAGSNNKTLKKIAIEYNFDFSHFKGQGWNLGKIPVNAIPLENILKKGTVYKSAYLRKRLIKANILQNKCSICGQLPVWNNKPLVLELDHIDRDTVHLNLQKITS